MHPPWPLQPPIRRPSHPQPAGRPIRPQPAAPSGSGAGSIRAPRRVQPAPKPSHPRGCKRPAGPSHPLIPSVHMTHECRSACRPALTRGQRILVWRYERTTSASPCCCIAASSCHFSAAVAALSAAWALRTPASMSSSCCCVAVAGALSRRRFASVQAMAHSTTRPRTASIIRLHGGLNATSSGTDCSCRW